MRRFPKVSDSLNSLYNTLYKAPPRFLELLDSPSSFTWNERKHRHSKKVYEISGFFSIKQKSSKLAKYNFLFSRTDLNTWEFAFSRNIEGLSYMGTEAIPSTEKSNSTLVFSTIYSIIIKFLKKVEPKIFSFSPFDNSLSKAYAWMGKVLSKRISNAYSYEYINEGEDFQVHIYERFVPRSKEAIDRYVEKVTIPDLMKNAGMSPKSLFFKKERYKVMGQEQGVSKFIECRLTKKGDMDFYFLAESTRKYKPGTKRKSADIKQGYSLKDNPSETYQITLRVKDFLKWADVYNTEETSLTEKDIIEILMVANVEIDSDVPGWYWQGGAYWLQQLDGTIYKRPIKKPQNKKNKGWARPYPKGHGDGQYFLDKNTQSIINSIRRYTKEMARKATELLKKEGYLQ